MRYPEISSLDGARAAVTNDPKNLSDPSGLDPCAENPACAFSPLGESSLQSQALVMIGTWALRKLGPEGPSPELLMNLPPIANDLLSARAFVAAEVFSRAQGLMKVAGGAAGFVAGSALCRAGMCGIGRTLMVGSADVAGAGVRQIVDGAQHQTVAGHFGGPATAAFEEAAVNAAGLAHAASLAAEAEAASSGFNASADASHAIVYEHLPDPGSKLQLPHYSIKVVSREGTLHTESFGKTNPYEVSLYDGDLSDVVRTHQVPLRNPTAADAYQRSVIGEPAGRFDVEVSNCLTHVGSVLNAGEGANLGRYFTSYELLRFLEDY